jgi:hypothetical protein
MAQTSYLQLDLLEVGQKEKETTINGNMTKLDQKVLRYLGDLASDPATTGVPAGSTYYNTATSKLKVLRANNTWANAA